MKQKQADITVFFSYAQADLAVRDRLAIHLSQLKRDGLIQEWSDQQIPAGSDRAQEINQAIHSAQIILLLISADFLASDTCYHVEMRQALERHKRGEAHVIPLIVRPCDWESSPFAHLQWLPRNSKPIANWHDQDEAFATIAKELRQIIKRQQFSDPSLSNRQPQNDVPADYALSYKQYNYSDSELLIKSTYGLPYHKVLLKVHEEYALNLDDYLAHQFDIYNVYRERQRQLRFYPGIVYRVIRPPILTRDGILQFDLATINFAYHVLLRDDTVPAEVKTYINNRISTMANAMPAELKSDHPDINSYNLTPLGIIMVLITPDNKTLLRQRGKSVLDSPKEWEAGFGGYCEEENFDFFHGTLSVAKTAEKELVEELGQFARDTNKIGFTGVHRNRHNGAIDLLGYWKIGIDTKQLVDVISTRYPDELTIAFETTRKATEEFVHDTHNIIVKFDADEIEEALKRAGGGVRLLIPEARAALDLALEGLGGRKLRLDS